MEKRKDNFIIRCLKNVGTMEKIEFAVLGVLLFVIHVLNIGKLEMPFVLEDEFGYLTHAATFSGFDWTSTARFMPYYSYGYSLLITPLMALFDDSALMYQAALVLNAIMLVGCYCCAKYAGKKLAPDVNGRLLNLAAFAVCLYPAYVAQAKLAWTECTLFLLFWLLVTMFISVNERPRMWKSALLAFLSVYIYAVHNRGLGILMASVITVVLMAIFKRIRIRDLIIYAGIIAAAFVIYTVINGVLKEKTWQGEGYGDINTISSQFTGTKLSFILSFEGVKTIVKRVIGQFYYLGAASLGVGILGFIELVQNNTRTFVRCSKKHSERPFREKNDTYTQLFILLSVLATVAISTYFITNSGVVRADTLFYGRYNEMFIGPVLLIGFIAMLRSDKYIYMKAAGTVLLLGITGLITYKRMVLNNSGNYNSICAIGLWDLPVKGDFSALVRSALIAACIFIVVCIAIAYAVKSGKKGIICAVSAVCLLVMGVSYFHVGNKNVTSTVLSMSGTNNKYKQIVNFLEDDNKEDLPVYFVIYDNFDMDRTKDFIQFAMHEESLTCIRDEELSKYPEDKYLIVYNSIGEEFIKLSQGYDVKLMANDRVLLKTSDNKDKQSGMEITGLYTSEGVLIENGEYTSTENGGIFIYGPYFTIAEGKYKITFDAELVSGEAENLGFAEFTGKGGEDKYDIVKFKKEDFADGKMQVTLNMEAPVSINGMELRVEAYKGTVLKVSNIRLDVNQEGITK